MCIVHFVHLCNLTRFGTCERRSYWLIQHVLAPPWMALYGQSEVRMSKVLSGRINTHVHMKVEQGLRIPSSVMWGLATHCQKMIASGFSHTQTRPHFYKL